MSFSIFPSDFSINDNVLYLGATLGVLNGNNFTITHNKDYAFKAFICINVASSKIFFKKGTTAGSGASFVSSNNNQVIFNNNSGAEGSYVVLGVV